MIQIFDLLRVCQIVIIPSVGVGLLTVKCLLIYCLIHMYIHPHKHLTIE